MKESSRAKSAVEEVKRKGALWLTGQEHGPAGVDLQRGVLPGHGAATCGLPESMRTTHGAAVA